MPLGINIGRMLLESDIKDRQEFRMQQTRNVTVANRNDLRVPLRDVLHASARPKWILVLLTRTRFATVQHRVTNDSLGPGLREIIKNFFFR